MRLFIAINFPEEIRDALWQESMGLREFAEQGSFSRKENLHLTLAFLGEVQPKRIKEIREIMDRLPKVPITLELSGFGAFSGRREQLYWRGAARDQALIDCRTTLCDMLRAAGFGLDAKPFKPHITMARRCVMTPDFSMETFRRQLQTLRFPVPGISLMRSEHIGGKLVYTEMYKVIL